LLSYFKKVKIIEYINLKIKTDMNLENKNLIILVIVAIVIFVIGFGLGFFLNSQNSAPKVNNNNVANLIGLLSLKTVPSITAFGQVSKIEGKNVTLFFNGDSMTIPVISSARINSVDSSKNNAQQEAKFENIKVGDALSVGLKVLPDGSLQGTSVFIMPSTIINSTTKK
jgi:hypothetical protein